MTTTRIDVARREVESGERRVPFRLDLREDAATVTLDGRDYRVAPLRWREKVTLARLAAGDPDVLRGEFLRLCVTPEPPDDDVLLELARWINDAPNREPVPFEGSAIAAVTLQLCRALHLSPAEFDAMRVADVEALFQALGAPAAEAAQPMANKIVIMPDPVAEESSSEAERAEPASLSRGSGKGWPPTLSETKGNGPGEGSRRGFRFRVLNTPSSGARDVAPASGAEGTMAEASVATRAELPAAFTRVTSPASGAEGTTRAELPSVPHFDIDDFAERLERAAAEMGIGEE
jgi:hypothetical protein